MRIDFQLKLTASGRLWTGCSRMQDRQQGRSVSSSHFEFSALRLFNMGFLSIVSHFNSNSSVDVLD